MIFLYNTFLVFSMYVYIIQNQYVQMQGFIMILLILFCAQNMVKIIREWNKKQLCQVSIWYYMFTVPHWTFLSIYSLRFLPSNVIQIKFGDLLSTNGHQIRYLLNFIQHSTLYCWKRTSALKLKDERNYCNDGCS